MCYLWACFLMFSISCFDCVVLVVEVALPFGPFFSWQLFLVHLVMHNNWQLKILQFFKATLTTKPTVAWGLQHDFQSLGTGLMLHSIHLSISLSPVSRDHAIFSSTPHSTLPLCLPRCLPLSLSPYIHPTLLSLSLPCPHFPSPLFTSLPLFVCVQVYSCVSVVEPPQHSGSWEERGWPSAGQEASDQEHRLWTDAGLELGLSLM